MEITGLSGMFMRRLLPALFLSRGAFAQILSSIDISPTLGPGETATAKVTLSAPVGRRGWRLASQLADKTPPLRQPSQRQPAAPNYVSGNRS